MAEVDGRGLSFERAEGGGEGEGEGPASCSACGTPARVVIRVVPVRNWRGLP